MSVRTIPRWQAVLALSSAATTLVGLGAVAGCTGREEPAAPTTAPTTSYSSSSSQAVTPSISRDVPPPERPRLGDLPAAGLCDLLSPEELEKLAFHVEPGEPSDTPPARGCTFHALNGVRSVLVAAQPPGYEAVGEDQVNLGPVPATETMHANDCTLFVGVRDATLQVTATAGEADSDQCEQAQAVGQYLLPLIAH